MRIRAGSLVVLLYLAAVALPSVAQVTTPDPAVRLLSVLRQATGLLANSATYESVQLVVPAIPLLSGAVPPNELKQFDYVPQEPTDRFASRPDPILAQLKLLDQNIELTTAILSPEQQDSLKKAGALLYTGGILTSKSKEYERYLEFESKYLDLRKALIAATNSAERTNIQLQLADTEKDWEVFGKRTEIRQAIDTVSKYSTDKVKDLQKSWEAILVPAGVSDYSKFWDTLALSSDWTAITATLTSQQLQGLTLRTSSGGKSDSTPIAGITQISFKFRVFSIPRAALEHQFLRSPNWRNTRSFVLSDGNAQKTTTAELVPRIVAALLVIKGVEIVFNSAEAWTAVANGLAKNTDVALGGLPIKGVGIPTPYLSPKYLSTAQPFVISAIVSDLPQIPATDPTSTWTWWKK